MNDGVKVQFVWHLHQPYYGMPDRPMHHVPWVRLHATRSYYDLARSLQSHPEAKATVNFSGSLIRQLREVLEDGHRDTWWDLSMKPASALDDYDRRHLLRHFFTLDHATTIRKSPRYLELLGRRDRGETFSVGDLRDLQVWFNLAWFGSYAREERPIVVELADKGRAFTEGEKEALLEQQLDVMHQVIPLYRELHRQGQVEISVSPMYHPILPLVIDSETAARTNPGSRRPGRYLARGDAAEHVWAARSIAREVLGVDIDGMWPAEGAISPETHALFAEHEVRWIVSGDDVLRRSLTSWDRDRDLLAPWRFGDAGPAMFFTERVPAPTSDGAAQLVDALRRGAAGVHTMVFDVANAIDGHHDGGREFWDALHSGVAAAPNVECTTPSAYLDEFGCDGVLDSLASGSWDGANFDPWIGRPLANRAWEALRITRQDFLRHVEAHAVDPEVEEGIWDSLLIAESSDWFGRYGGETPSEEDPEKDRVFRAHLRFVYERLGLTPPSFADTPIGPVPSAAPFQVPTRLISPRIDGATDSYYEWEGAGRYEPPGSGGQMYESSRVVDVIFVGYDLEHLFVRVDWTSEARRADQEVEVTLNVQHTAGLFTVSLVPGGVIRWRQDDSEIPLFEVELGASLEAALPWVDIELGESESFAVYFEVRVDGVLRERHPRYASLDLIVPDPGFDARYWNV